MPYDEQFYIDHVGPELANDYKEANRIIGDDEKWIVWPARIQADIDMGLSNGTSLAKHRREWRKGLGLDQHPNQPSLWLPVHTDGRGFRTSDNRDWQFISVSGFTLAKRAFEGEDIQPFINYARARNANVIRIFAMCKNLADFNPKNYDTYFSDWDGLVRLLRANNLGAQVTIFADGPLVMPSHLTQRNFYVDLVNSLSEHDNVFIDDVNENDQPENHIDTNQLTTYQDGLSSAGSNGMDADPVTPIKDWAPYHIPRDNEWYRKLKSAREYSDKWGIPVTNDETNRPDIDGYNVAHFRTAGLVSGLLCSGINGHSNNLKVAQLPTDREDECINTMLSAATSIEPVIKRGEYTKDGLTTCPMYNEPGMQLRTYAIINGNKSWAVIVDPSNNNPRKGINGWKVVSENDGYFELVR